MRLDCNLVLSVSNRKLFLLLVKILLLSVAKMASIVYERKIFLGEEHQEQGTTHGNQTVRLIFTWESCASIPEVRMRTNRNVEATHFIFFQFGSRGREKKNVFILFLLQPNGFFLVFFFNFCLFTQIRDYKPTHPDSFPVVS